MVCPNCGKELPDGSTYCDNCGTKLTPDAKPDTEEASEEKTEEKNVEETNAAAEETAAETKTETEEPKAETAEAAAEPVKEENTAEQAAEEKKEAPAGEAKAPEEKAAESAQASATAQSNAAENQASQSSASASSGTVYTTTVNSSKESTAEKFKRDFKPGTKLFKDVIAALIALVVIIVVICIVAANGGSASSTAKKACRALTDVDLEEFYELVPDEVLEEDGISENDIEDAEDYLSEAIEDLEDNTDEDLKLSYDIKRIRDVDNDAMDDIERYYAKHYDLEVSDVKEARVKFLAELGKDEYDTDVVSLYLIKVDGDWYIDTLYSDEYLSAFTYLIYTY